MKKIALIILNILIFAACTNNKPQKTTIDGLALGTSYHIVICADTTHGTMALINQKIDQVNESMSIYNPNSRLSKINRNETQDLDSMLMLCINQALKISKESNGMYDITIKPLTDAWGFATKEKTADPNVDSLLTFVGYKKIKIEGNKLIKENPQTQIDLNSIAKGSTVDLVSQALESLGYTDFLVEIGGEVFARGTNTIDNHKWNIGIDNPSEGNMQAGANITEVIALSNQALATSGNYRRYYTDENGNKVVHTMNPKTGFSSPSKLLSATVIAENCALADAYATTLMSLGLEGAIEFSKAHPELKIYLIYSNDNDKMQTYSSGLINNN